MARHPFRDGEEVGDLYFRVRRVKKTSPEGCLQKRVEEEQAITRWWSIRHVPPREAEAVVGLTRS